MLIQICVGSSCHLKGSEKVVNLFEEAVSVNHLDDDVILTGSFCAGRCNRTGVTICVDDDTYTGVTPDNFDEFFRSKVLEPLQKERG